MQLIQKLLHRVRTMHVWAKRALLLGTYLMLFYLIVGLSCRLAAPYTDRYFYFMAVYRGCMEGAPAALATGVCAAVLGDLMLTRSGRDKRDKDD